jgi:Surfeit locus protein 5 subunit 22 of Mediator complex
MERIETEATPAEDWLQSFNATCNRLSTQYLNVLRAASSVSALEQQGRQSDPRAGGHMPTAQDPPPPALAADVALAAAQCQLATENICVASSQLLSLIRTLRLSILLMDEEMMDAEQEWQVQEAQAMTQEAQREAVHLEQELIALRNTHFR